MPVEGTSVSKTLHETNQMIERKIIIGLITSTEYLQKIEPLWNSSLMDSVAAKRMAVWCWKYYHTYQKAPGHDIEGIFFNKVKNGLDEDTANDIEQNILPGLSEEFENDPVNVKYLVDETIAYFNERQLSILQENIQVLLDKNKPDEARKLAEEYRPIVVEDRDDLELSDRKALQQLEKAFEENENYVVTFPRQLGDFWNHQMVRGGFIGILAPEKRGKTFMLMEFAIRACRQGSKVAFFQAGDMTEAQQLKRFSIYLTKKNTHKKYCGKMYEPVRDCINSQLGICDKDFRQNDYGVFEGMDKKTLLDELTMEDLIEAFKDNPQYEPCHNCSQYWELAQGVPWLKMVDVGEEPLGVHEAKRAWRKFFMRHKRSLKLATYANGTLTVKEINRVLDVWKKEGFEPDLILIDYAELLDDPTQEYRHKQNNIWKGVRRITQERDALVIMPTQADADSYGVNTLSLKNFSEDKRKYSHCTAFYGLNQDPKGREKKIGLLRINELMVREGSFDPNKPITILQNLRRGRPFLGSYF